MYSYEVKKGNSYLLHQLQECKLQVQFESVLDEDDVKNYGYPSLLLVRQLTITIVKFIRQNSKPVLPIVKFMSQNRLIFN